MGTYEQIFTLFENASDRDSLPLSSNDIEQFAKRAAFALDIGARMSAGADRLLPKIALPFQVDDAARLAAQVRDLFEATDLDPLYQLPVLIDNVLGTILFTVDQRSIAGACALINDTPFIFVSTSSDIDVLYTCARQLGHLLPLAARQRQVFIELAHENTHAPRGPYRRFADHFALELLIPTRGLAVALKEVRHLLRVTNPAIGDIELLYLSRIFGVSFLGMTRRCERAGLLPEGGAAILYQALVDKHGGPEKRADAAMIPPRPTMNLPPMSQSLVVSVASQIHKGQLSLEEVERESGLPSEYLAQLLKPN